MTSQQEQIKELKEKYIEYYKDLPVQKYAAMYIGRDEETIMRWKKDDVDFEGRVNQARADWVRRKASKAKVEFALERLEKSAFGQKIEVEQTGDNTVAEILKAAGLTGGQNGNNRDNDETPEGSSQDKA